MKTIGILGSTGSIGTQTLDVVRANGDISVKAIAAGSNIRLLEEQIREFNPAVCGVWDEERAEDLAPAGQGYGYKDRIRHGRPHGDRGHGRI